MKLYVVKEDERPVWVAAVVGEDVWTYVANTGKFHRNDGARHDYFFLNELQYLEIGITGRQPARQKMWPRNERALRSTSRRAA